MMEDETGFEPLFEFEAPKYVDLRYAASEEGFNDGADDWFDQMKTKSSSIDSNLRSSSRDSENAKRGERTTWKELTSNKPSSESNLRTDSHMVTARIVQLQQKNGAVTRQQCAVQCDKTRKFQTADPIKEVDESQQVLTEATNQINLLSLGHNHSQSEPSVSNKFKKNSSKIYSLMKPGMIPSSVNEAKHKGNSPENNDTIRMTSIERKKGVAKNTLAKRVPIELSTERYHSEAKAKNISVTEVLPSNTSTPNRNNQVAERQRTTTNKRISACHTTQPKTPKFFTDERALRHRERVEKLREQSKAFIEPKTPKEYGLSWKPQPTRAKTPHFRSDLRLRHCVEKVLLEREKQSHSSRPKELPRIVAFGQHTARRAEMYKQQKNILSHEEMELMKIEDERRKLRETIMKSRDNFKRALDAPILATSNIQIRKSTVPKEFHFHTQRHQTEHYSVPL
ncbi:hypothetical protein GpartN1_g3114.t1 [Galdieria partita]|uniref:Uncharacterized protein n=1 Tax=Galdieria partita TaxID=83374 RepID=A0A9C7PUY2_9RHOD|nr:hypothetical protein GpartN1_g3114.t1 [Galdieria partita]